MFSLCLNAGKTVYKKFINIGFYTRLNLLSFMFAQPLNSIRSFYNFLTQILHKLLLNIKVLFRVLLILHRPYCVSNKYKLIIIVIRDSAFVNCGILGINKYNQVLRSKET